MNTPTPTVPVGLGTKLGLLTAAVAALVAGIAAIAAGDHTPETITGLIVAGFTVYGIVRSRGDQAAAIYGARPAPVQYVATFGTATLDTAEGELVPDLGDEDLEETDTDLEDPVVHPTVLGPRWTEAAGHGDADLGGEPA